MNNDTKQSVPEKLSSIQKIIHAVGWALLIIAAAVNALLAYRIATQQSLDSLAWTTGIVFIIIPLIGFNLVYFSARRNQHVLKRSLLLMAFIFAVNAAALMAAAWYFFASDASSTALGEATDTDMILYYPFAPLVILAAAGFMTYFVSRTNYADKEAAYLESGKGRITIRPLPVIVHAALIIPAALLWGFLALIPILVMAQPNTELWGRLMMFGGEAPAYFSEYSELWVLSNIYGILFGAILASMLMSLVKKLMYKLPIGRTVEPRSSLWQRLSTFQPYLAALAGLLATIGARFLLQDDDASVFAILLAVAAFLLVLCVVIIALAKKFRIPANELNIAQSLLSPKRWD